MALTNVGGEAAHFQSALASTNDGLDCAVTEAGEAP